MAAHALTTSRRTFLAGAPAVALAAAIPAAALAAVSPAEHDPLLVLINELERQRDICNAEGADDDRTIDENLASAAFQRMGELDQLIIGTRATTPAGAAAALRLARYEFDNFYSNTDIAEDLMRSLLDSAMALLKKA